MVALRHCLEKATRWVDVDPLPSPVAEARMPPWARDLLLARVSRVPRAALLAGTGPLGLCGSPGLSSPSCPLGGPCGLKRKREFGEADGRSPAVPTPPAPVESGERGACSHASGVGVAQGGLPSVKVESPSWSPVPGEDSFPSDYSGEEDEGGTYLCPAWAIKHPIPHLVYTSAYEGNDCTGAYWADADPGGGVAMRIVTRPADTAVDSASGDDGGSSLPRTADYNDGRIGGPQGTDDVGLCPHRPREELGCLAVSPYPPDRWRRSLPGTPMGLRETARYGLRVLRIGEASHPGPGTPGPPTPALGIRTMSCRLLLSPRGWPASMVLWPLCVRSIRPSRLRGLASLGPTPLATRRGLSRLTRHGRPLGPGLLPRLSPARLRLPLPPMGAGQATGPITLPPPVFTLGSGARSGLELGTGMRHLPRLTAPVRKVGGL